MRRPLPHLQLLHRLAAGDRRGRCRRARERMHARAPDVLLPEQPPRHAVRQVPGISSALRQAEECGAAWLAAQLTIC